jgi:hypothetical protein
VVSFTPRPLYPWEKSPRYPFYRRLGGLQSRSERRGEEHFFDSTGTQTPTPQSLYQLRYPGSVNYIETHLNLEFRGTPFEKHCLESVNNVQHNRSIKQRNGKHGSLSYPSTRYRFFFNLHSGGVVQTWSTRHVGHLLAYCTCPG